MDISSCYCTLAEPYLANRAGIKHPFFFSLVFSKLFLYLSQSLLWHRCKSVQNV